MLWVDLYVGATQSSDSIVLRENARHMYLSMVRSRCDLLSPPLSVPAFSL